MPGNLHRGVGSRILWLSTRMAVKTTSPWVDLGCAYSHFSLQCSKSTASSNFSVKLQGLISTGGVGNTPLALVAYTQAAVGTVKQSTLANPAPVTKIRFSSTTFTTGAGKGLIITVCATP